MKAKLINTSNTLRYDLMFIVGDYAEILDVSNHPKIGIVTSVSESHLSIRDLTNIETFIYPTTKFYYRILRRFKRWF